MNIFKMDPAHNVETFIFLLELFSEAQLLHPKISNYKEVGCLFSDMRNKQIILNKDIKLFENEIHSMNKTSYTDLHTYTEVKSTFILAEERKSSKTNKISETKKPKDNRYGPANAGNIKTKESKQ